MWIRTASSLLRYHRVFSVICMRLRCCTQQVTVEPFCKIRVKTSCPLLLRPFDLIDNPANNKIKATLLKNKIQLDIKLEDGADQQLVTISEKLTKFMGQDEILLEVPVQIDLAVEGSETVSLSDIDSDSIVVHAMNGIRTKNIKSQEIEFVSGAGGVESLGTLVGKNMTIRTEQDGRVHLEKVLGDAMSVETIDGNITINSCYIHSSKFRTKNGDLLLKNIHKNCEVSVEEEANLTMTGFNGNLLVTVNKGYVNLQIAELHGESVILANNATDMDLKLGEEVSTSTYVHAAVDSDKFHLDEHLEPARAEKENGASTLNMSGCPNKLFIQTDGSVRIKQQSWTETLFGVPEL